MQVFQVNTTMLINERERGCERIEYKIIADSSTCLAETPNMVYHMICIPRY